jgi:hypothetical protein
VLRDQPDNLDAYLGMSAEDVARLVLCLLIEELLAERLSAFRYELPAQQNEIIVPSVASSGKAQPEIRFHQPA